MTEQETVAPPSGKRTEVSAPDRLVELRERLAPTFWEEDAESLKAMAYALDLVNGPPPETGEDFPSWQRDWAAQVLLELEDLGFTVAPLAERQAAEQRVAALEEGLRAVGELQPNALAYVRSNGFVFDVVGPLPDDADELTRWKVLAFSLYSDLCEAESKARSLLSEAQPNLQSSAASQGDEE